MSREILFRGKQKHDGIWIEGYFSKDYAGIAYITTLDGVSTSVVDEATISQFTGLTDKNGVKIFEGDKVQVVGGSGKDYVVEYRFASFWQIAEFGFSTILDDHDVSYLVTGNIHDK